MAGSSTGAALASGVLLALAACRAERPPAGPLTLVDDAGTAVAVAPPARRIVSLIPATTELLFALGAGDRLVGRTTWCDYPPAVAAVPDLGNGMDPNVEAIAAAGPDLVLLYRSGANRPAAERLGALGIPVLELATDRLDDLTRITRLLGRAVGRAAAADSLVANLEREVAASTAAPADRPSVFLIVWDRPIMTLGRGSFLSEIVARAGARNIFDDIAASSATVSIEAVAARDPDYVLVSGDAEPEWAGRREWQVVRAVRERRFLRVSGSEYNRPSPRMPAAIRRLAASLAPPPERR